MILEIYKNRIHFQWAKLYSDHILYTDNDNISLCQCSICLEKINYYTKSGDVIPDDV